MNLSNFFTKHNFVNNPIWKNELVSAIKNFKKQFGVFPSYILANDYTHSLIDFWTNHTAENESKLTHFIIDGIYIHLVFDNQISDNVLGLQYDTFFELEKNVPSPLPSRRKNKRSVHRF